ncbi:hypothetical protein MMC07_000608 [Pseudocyphellaria aurata]|nr:hypothetical protein [Pseudocyphellaria aurata]
MAISSIQSLPLELLENILLQLPMSDLLFAQSVCRQWQATVKGLPKVQKALFMHGESEPIDPVENTLLYNRFCGWKIAYSYAIGDPVASFIDLSSAPKYIQHPASSWRKMFLSQPPCEDLKFFTSCGVKRWDYDSDDDSDDILALDQEKYCLHCDGGITMEALMHEIQRVFDHKPVNYWSEVYEDTFWVLKLRNFCAKPESQRESKC